jgi:hypothetical protein
VSWDLFEAGQGLDQVGNRKFKARVTSLTGEDRAAAYQRVVAQAPIYAGYERRTDREIPVLRVTPEP